MIADPQFVAGMAFGAMISIPLWVFALWLTK